MPPEIICPEVQPPAYRAPKINKKPPMSPTNASSDPRPNEIGNVPGQ